MLYETESRNLQNLQRFGAIAIVVLFSFANSQKGSSLDKSPLLFFTLRLA